MNDAATPQPAPTKRDTPGMHDLVTADIRRGRPRFSPLSHNTEALVMIDLEARKQFGLEKYGTLLQAFNGRDALMDAYQETLDQVVYLCQYVDEHPTDEYMRMAYSDSLKLAMFLRRRLEVRVSPAIALQGGTIRLALEGARVTGPHALEHAQNVLELSGVECGHWKATCHVMTEAGNDTPNARST